MSWPDPVTVWTGGRRKLGKDPVFGPWVRKIGTIRIPQSTEEPFFYLLRAICYQQLAGKAAATIHGRERVLVVTGGKTRPPTGGLMVIDPADGAVDFSDFLVLSTRFGKQDASWLDGDLDDDQTVTFRDFLVFADQFGT